ncbi:MAG: hypothetical protein AABY54_07515 [Deltaproteobacteria bacterium]
MSELIIKPVRYGIIIGLLGLLLGISWAFWLVLGHERIHRSLEKSVVERKEVDSLIDILGPDNAQANTKAKEEHNEHSHGQASNNEDTHHHEEEKPMQKDEHIDMSEGQHMMQTGEDKHQHGEGAHDSPIMELAHKRLVRGHLHLMGLGLVTVVVSLILVFTSAPPLFKTIASVFTGIGGIIYPAAWIVMGYMTPRLGAAGAEAYVTVIAGPGVLLVTFGIVSTVIYLLKDIFSEKL